MRRGSEVVTSNRMNVVFAVMMNSSGKGTMLIWNGIPIGMHLALWAVESLAALGLLRHILLVDAFELLFQWRLLRGASRLARVVPRAAAHRVPAPLAGPVGIFGFVVRGSGRGGRQCGRHRQYADQDSHNHGCSPCASVGNGRLSTQSGTGSRRLGGPTPS